MKCNPVELPLKLKTNNHYNISRLFVHSICSVSVLWLIYDSKKKRIIHSGSSRARGYNHYNTSTHAEENALTKLKSLKNNNKLEIYIWKWDKLGNYKHKFCCYKCTNLAYKYGFNDRIFTFMDNKKCNAIIPDPQLSLAYLIDK